MPCARGLAGAFVRGAGDTLLRSVSRRHNLTRNGCPISMHVLDRAGAPTDWPALPPLMPTPSHCLARSGSVSVAKPLGWRPKLPDSSLSKKSSDHSRFWGRCPFFKRSWTPPKKKRTRCDRHSPKSNKAQTQSDSHKKATKTAPRKQGPEKSGGPTEKRLR